MHNIHPALPLRHRLLAVLAAVPALILSLVSGAEQPAPRYTVIPIGDGSTRLTAAYALNGHGHIAGVAGRTAYLYREGQLVDLGKLPGPFVYPYAINDSGQVVGQGGSADNVTAAFLWEDRQMKNLGLGLAYDLDAEGRIVGFVFDPIVQRSRAVIWHRGMIIPLGPEDGESSAFAINARGQVAGVSNNRAVVWTDGQPREIGPMGSQARDINDAGVVIMTLGDRTPLLWENGQTIELATPPGAKRVIVGALNNKGQIVGSVTEESGVRHAALWENHQPLNLNRLIAPGSGWKLTDARAINDHGLIVGVGEFEGKRAGFLLTPSGYTPPPKAMVTAGQPDREAQPASPLPARAQKKRPFSVDDVFALESLGFYYGGPFAFSPDGSKLAVARQRPRTQWATHKTEGLWYNAGGDIWVQNDPKSAPRKITNNDGGKDGWWAPQWSPDGRRLAMLSTRGGRTGLWLWTEATGEIRPLTTRHLDVSGFTEAIFIWLDNERIIVSLWPENAPLWSRSPEQYAQQTAAAGWKETAEGRKTTASVVEAGLPPPEPAELREICVLNIRDGAITPMAASFAYHFVPAPRGGAVAFGQYADIEQPKLGVRLVHGAGATATFNAVSPDGRLLLDPAKLPRNIRPFSLAWTPDAGEVVALSNNGTTTDPVTLYRADVRTGEVATTSLENLLPVFPCLAQTSADGSVLVFANLLGKDGQREPRADWWKIDRAGRRTNLTAALETAPTTIFPEPGHGTFIGGIAGKAVVRLRVAEARIENLTERMSPAVDLAWPGNPSIPQVQPVPFGTPLTKIVINVYKADTNAPELQVLDLGSGQSAPLKTTRAGAVVLSFSPPTQSAVLSYGSNTSTLVERNGLQSGAVALFTMNEFLDQIDQGTTRRFDYTSLDGEKLSGTLLLPAGHVEGKRWPVLVWGYPGRNAPRRFELNDAYALNLNIPAGRGYAVLAVSMPLKTPEGQADDVMLRLPNGVLPAIDAAVATGTIDPARVYFFGHSFGGYAAYGIAALTSRFTAIISSAGFTNLTSAYGQFRPTVRYRDNPMSDLWTLGYYESAQVRLGLPPWGDAARYQRNSPIHYVGRVTTPMLILFGDMDYLGMAQGEEFFTALYRQGKRARFVRYWGEGHNFVSPANVKDYWEQIFRWMEDNQFKKE